MPIAIWTEEHVDFLERLARHEDDLSSQQMATRMSQQFHVRVTVSHVNTLLQRMRNPSDLFYRNIPYRRRGARYHI